MTNPALLASVNATIQHYEEALGRPATRTRQMIERRGVKEALAALMVSADLQKGFRVLRDNGQLARTFEALIVEFSTEFEPATVELAQWRLDNAHNLDLPRSR